MRSLAPFALASLSVLCACGQAERTTRPEDCERWGASAIKGTWNVTAVGRRSACADPRDDGKVVIRIGEFRVYPGGDGQTGPLVAGPLPGVSDDPELTPSFEGETEACELGFRIHEPLPNGQALDYVFEGFVTGDSRASGALRGSGPGSCVVEGDFELAVE